MTNTLFGIHAVTAALEANPDKVTELFVQSGRADKRLLAIIALANKHNLPVHHVGKDVLETKSEYGKHQGVVALCQQTARTTTTLANENDLMAMVEDAPSNLKLLILDGVQDPHNLGACLRTCDAVGVDAVIIPSDKAVSVNATVSKVACGAAETVPVVTVTNLVRTMQSLQELGVWIYGLAGEAEHSLYDNKLTGRLAIVMGAEGKGLRRLVRETCDHLIKIPMVGTVESLNVSVATAVCLYEVLRQSERA